MIYLELLITYLQIGLFSIGGGHASIPIVKAMVVDGKGWMTMQEFTDMITLSEMTPGPFAINSATFIGIKMGGFLGGLVATVSFLIPSVLICLVLYKLIKKYRKLRLVDGFMRGIRPAVTGLISSAGALIVVMALFGANTLAGFQFGNFNLIAFLIGTICFILLRTTKINSIIVIFIAGALGMLAYSIF